MISGIWQQYLELPLQTDTNNSYLETLLYKLIWILILYSREITEEEKNKIPVVILGCTLMIVRALKFYVDRHTISLKLLKMHRS